MDSINLFLKLDSSDIYLPRNLSIPKNINFIGVFINDDPINIKDTYVLHLKEGESIDKIPYFTRDKDIYKLPIKFESENPIKTVLDYEIRLYKVGSNFSKDFIFSTVKINDKKHVIKTKINKKQVGTLNNCLITSKNNFLINEDKFNYYKKGDNKLLGQDWYNMIRFGHTLQRLGKNKEALELFKACHLKYPERFEPFFYYIKNSDQEEFDKFEKIQIEYPVMYSALEESKKFINDYNKKENNNKENNNKENNKKEKIKIIILVIASSNKDFEQFKKIQKKYMNSNPDIRTLFVYGDCRVENESYYDLKFDNIQENYIPGVLLKTINALEFINNNYDYDHLIRTNLSTIFDFNALIDTVDKLPINKCYAGWKMYHHPYNFISGTGIILSKDLTQKLVSSLKYKSINTALPDDVAIGSILEPFIKEVKNLCYCIDHTNPLVLTNKNQVPKGYVYFRLKNNEERKNRDQDINNMKFLCNYFYDI